MKSNELLDKVLGDVSCDTPTEQTPPKACVKGLTFPQGDDTPQRNNLKMKANTLKAQDMAWVSGLVGQVLAFEASTGVSILQRCPDLEDQFDAAVTAGNERVARNMAGLIEKKLREAV